MKMMYELITPKKAKMMLANNHINRPISHITVEAYARDIENGKWTEETATAIALSKDGVLLDGQHRLSAIVKAGIPIHSWICTECDVDGTYDNNRRRTIRDQINIKRSDLPTEMRNNAFLAMVKVLAVGYGARITIGDTEQYIDEHYDDLKAFCDLGMFKATKAKISITPVYFSLYMAFVKGVDGEKISRFMEVLRIGMSECPEEYPIIAYRNYLLDVSGSLKVTNDEVKKCQGALKKYITGSCLKRLYIPKDVIWDIRKEDSNA